MHLMNVTGSAEAFRSVLRIFETVHLDAVDLSKISVPRRIRGMHRQITAVLIPLALTGIVTSALAGRGANSVRVPEFVSSPLQDRQCARLFGDHASREANRRHRVRRLLWVDEEAAGVSVVHSSKTWALPTPLRVRGLTLKALRLTDEGKTAEIAVTPELGDRVGCRAGRYRVRVDDNLGGDVRVLAILRDAVLVEHRQRLRFIARPGASKHRWLTAWGSAFTVRLAANHSATPSSPPLKRRWHSVY